MKKLAVLLLVVLSFASCPQVQTSEPATYTVKYNGNGAGVKGEIVDTNTYDAGQAVTVKGGNGMVNSGYSFTGWNTQSNGATASYLPGDQFPISSNVTLYAMWQAGGSGILVADPAKGRDRK